MATLQGKTHVKCILHASKHPASTVVGLLVAPEKDGKDIVDALPLVHHWVHLSFAAEAGLRVARATFEKLATTGKAANRIVGVYVANARLDDTQIPAPVKALAGSIAETNGAAALVVVINSNEITSAEPFEAYNVANTDSKPSPVALSYPHDTKKTSEAVLARVRESRPFTLEDFDDHLEDIGSRWLSDSEDVKTILDKSGIHI